MKRIENILFIICLIIFIFISYLVLTHNDIVIDSYVYNFISKFINNRLTRNIIYLTNIGSSISVISICIISLIVFKDKIYGILISINLCILGLIQVIFKSIFTRSRPLDINLIVEKGYSFPSGHSLTSLAFYGFIIYLIYKSKLNIGEKRLLISMLSIIILVIGLSRVYLGVHYFTDVIGGFTLSYVYLFIYIKIVKKYLKS